MPQICYIVLCIAHHYYHYKHINFIVGCSHMVWLRHNYAVIILAPWCVHAEVILYVIIYDFFIVYLMRLHILTIVNYGNQSFRKMLRNP